MDVGRGNCKGRRFLNYTKNPRCGIAGPERRVPTTERPGRAYNSDARQDQRFPAGLDREDQNTQCPASAPSTAHIGFWGSEEKRPASATPVVDTLQLTCRDRALVICSLGTAPTI